MLNFHPLTLADIPSVRRVFADTSSRLCDESVGGLFMWRDYFGASIAFEADVMVIRYSSGYGGDGGFSIASGPGALNAVRKTAEFCRDQHLELKLCTVPPSLLERLKGNFNVFSAEEDPWSDYLYLASDLRDYPGSRYAAKRNHVHQFRKLWPDAECVPLTQEVVPETIAFLDRFTVQEQEDEPSGIEELRKTYEVVRNMESYGLCGMVLRTRDGIAGLSVAEKVGDTLIIHIEKADLAFKGVYSVLASAIVSFCNDPSIRYVNREDDAGDPGLRKSKLSYHPVEMLKKYTVKLALPD